MTINFSLFICAIRETEIHCSNGEIWGNWWKRFSKSLLKQDPLRKAFKCSRRSPTGNIDPIYVNVYFITIQILQIR